MLKALIFDVDGTLADSERLGHRVAFNRAFQDFGLDWQWSEEVYGNLLAVTGGKERLRHFIQRDGISIPGGVRDVDHFIEALHARKNWHYTALVESGELPLRPGVRRLLNEARKEGLRLAIATTTTPANVDALLKATLGPDSVDWFEVIAAGDIVPRKKPAPDVYQFVLAQLGVHGSDCLAFEDSATGFRAARAAGIPVIVTLNGYTERQSFEDPVLVVDHLGDDDAPCKRLAGCETAVMDPLDLPAVRQLHSRWVGRHG